jgi:Mg-chelatase subunit ChlD
MNRRITLGKGLGALLALTAAFAGCESKSDRPAEPVIPKNSVEGTAVMYIVDSSGSMSANLSEGKSRIEVAKETLEGLAGTFRNYSVKNPNTMVGMICFDGDGVKTVIPMGEFNYNNFINQVRSLKANSNTPLGQALVDAEVKLDDSGRTKKYIVALSDGLNNAGVDPDTAYSSIIRNNTQNKDSSTHLHIIALNLDEVHFKGLKDKGAVVYSAKDRKELEYVFNESVIEILEAPEGSSGN